MSDAMPMLEHFRELKRRVVYSILAFFTCTIVGYLNVEPIYQFLTLPLRQSLGVGQSMIYTGLAEAFVTYINLACWFGVVTSFPIIAWQIYGFFAPALKASEKRLVVPFIIAAPILFTLGMAMAYFFIFPLAWKFFLSFQMPSGADMMGISLQARVSEYLSLVTGLVVAFGLAFQLPLVLVLMGLLGMITPEILRKKRRYAIVGIFLVAAVITPPDVISQVGLALPLILLYESAVIALHLLAKKSA